MVLLVASKKGNTSVTVLGLLLPYNLVQDGQAAQKYGTAKHTLWHRDHRRENRPKAHEDEQTLDAVEEDELVDWLRELDEWGLHLRRSLVISRVKTIVAGRTVFISTDHIGTNVRLLHQKGFGAIANGSGLHSKFSVSK
jgi:hypothetical protein